jgi:ribosomal protein S27AE
MNCSTCSHDTFIDGKCELCGSSEYEQNKEVVFRIRECQKCGSYSKDAILLRFHNNLTGTGYYVTCGYCGNTSKDLMDTPEEAVEYWNDRHDYEKRYVVLDGNFDYVRTENIDE